MCRFVFKFVLLTPKFLFLLQIHIGTKYWLSVSLITNNQSELALNKPLCSVTSTVLNGTQATGQTFILLLSS